MTVYLINTPSLPTPGSHHYTISKFARGFRHNGLDTGEVLTDPDLASMPDQRGDMLIVANHGLNPRTAALLKRFKEATVIGWFFHDWVDAYGPPCERFILTGEHFRQVPVLQDHQRFWDIQQRVDYYEPLTFAFDKHPDDVGKIPRITPYNHDACFIGFAYKDAWTRAIERAAYDVFKYYSPPFLDETVRINKYLGSTVCLGWHHDNNLANHVVVERVFEGMGYGCVVITDSWDAYDVTSHIVRVVTTQQEALNAMSYWTGVDPRYIKEQQERQYEWLRAHGTYYHVAQRFLAKQKELGYV